MACAAKSNAVYVAFGAAMEDARRHGHPRGAAPAAQRATALMKGLGYGAGYRYAHDEPDAYAAGERYFPDAWSPRATTRPVERGLETASAEALARLRSAK